MAPPQSPAWTRITSFGALDAFTDALEGAIDLGDVNGRPFLNNASPGVYGAAVQREGYARRRRRRGGLRPALDSGRLGVLVLYRPGGPPGPPGRGWTARSLDVTAGDAVAAGLDGEAIQLESTIHFTVRPRALRVPIPISR